MKNKKHGIAVLKFLALLLVIGVSLMLIIPKIDFDKEKGGDTVVEKYVDTCLDTYTDNNIGVQTDFRSYQLAMETVAREDNGFDLSDTVTSEDETDLINKINSNLDKNLKITDNTESVNDSTINACDPWKEEYKIEFNGSDKSVKIISGGPDRIIGGDNKDDDYTITTYYTSEGIKTNTTGFSKNQ